jgi:FO synthase
VRTGKVISFEEAVRAMADGEISRQSGGILIRARAGDELDLLMKEAAGLRDRFKGRTVTYSRKVFIPLTNLCRDYCGYCTFRKDPWEVGARTMTPDDVLEVAKAGERLGCKEALFSLGDRPEAAFGEMRDGLAGLGHKTTLSYLGEISRRVLEETGLLPHSNPGTDAREHQRTIEWARDGARQRSR